MLAGRLPFAWSPARGFGLFVRGAAAWGRGAFLSVACQACHIYLGVKVGFLHWDLIGATGLLLTASVTLLTCLACSTFAGGHFW